MRLAMSTATLLLAACGGADPLKVDAPPAQEAAPKPTVMATDTAALPTPQTRIAAMKLVCSGESLRVAFEERRAVVINDTGGNTELARLPPDPNAGEGAATYTNGKVSFYKSAGGDTPTTVRYAIGRAVPQDCAIAVN